MTGQNCGVVKKLMQSFNRLKNTVNLLLAIDLVSVYFELLKVVQNDLTSYFLPKVAQTKEYCAFQVNFVFLVSFRQWVTKTLEFSMLTCLGALHRTCFKNSARSRFIQCNCQILLGY